MADVTEEDGAQEVPQSDASEFQKYLTSHPELGHEMMKIVVLLYNSPMKLSQVQPYIQKLMEIEKHDISLADQLRQENYDLQNEIFDMQDQLLAMEKEYEEIKEEDI